VSAAPRTVITRTSGDAMRTALAVLAACAVASSARAQAPAFPEARVRHGVGSFHAAFNSHRFDRAVEFTTDDWASAPVAVGSAPIARDQPVLLEALRGRTARALVDLEHALPGSDISTPPIASVALPVLDLATRMAGAVLGSRLHVLLGAAEHHGGERGVVRAMPWAGARRWHPRSPPRWAA